MSSERDNIVSHIRSAPEEKVLLGNLNNRDRRFRRYSVHLAPDIPVENQVSDYQNLFVLEFT
jgi:hypothetical protein